MKPLGQIRTFKGGSLTVHVSNSNWVKQTRFQNYAMALGLPSWMLLQPCRVRIDGTRVKVAEGGYIIGSENASDEEYSTLTTLARLLRIRVIRTRIAVRARVISLSRPSIGILSDAGSPYAFYDILSSTGFRCVPVSSTQIRSGDIYGLGMIVIPGGGERGPPFQSQALGEEGRQNLANFVKKGNAVWGSCAGAMNLVRVSEAERSLLSSEYHGPSLVSAELVDAAYWGKGGTGIGLLQVEVQNRKDPLVFNIPARFDLTWHLGPLLFMEKRKTGRSRPIIKCIGKTRKFTPSEYLYSEPRHVRWSETYTAQGIKRGTYGIVVSHIGKGTALASGAHPEFGSDFLLERWNFPAKILVNFTLLATPSGSISQRISRSRRIDTRSVRAAIQNALEEVRKIRILASELRNLSSNAWWLQPEHAPSSFGRAAKHNWSSVQRRLEKASSGLPKLLRESNNRLHAVQRLAIAGRSNRKSSGVRRSLLALLMIEASWLEEYLTGRRFRLLDHPDRDYGWETIPTLVTNCKAKLDKARSAIIRGTSEDPASAPYMLIWGMYTGALYDLINAEILLKRRIETIDELLTLRIKDRKRG